MTNISSRDQLILDWQSSQEMLARAKETEMSLRMRVVSEVFPEKLKPGVNNYDLGRGYTLKATGRLNYNLANGDGQTERALDDIEAIGNEGKFIADRLVIWKPSLSISEYKKLEVSGDNPNPAHVKIKAIIDNVLTITDGSPELEVVAPKGRK